MATADTARLEAQLDALEESLFKLGTRAELAGGKADQAAAQLANLYAQQAAGANVSAEAVRQAQATFQGLDAEVLALSGRSAGLEELLAQMRELSGEAAVGLAPAFRNLVKLAGEAADAEAKRAAGMAAIPGLEAAVAAAEAELARARAAGAGEGQALAGLARAGTALDRARQAQAPLDTLAAATSGSYQRGAAQLGERVGAAQAGGGVAGTAQEALGGLVGMVNTTTVAFGLASAAVLGSVQAYSPATVMQFQQALKDLSATFGVALAPVMDGLTTLAREVGGALLPIMEQLAPVFEQLTQTALQVLLPVIDVWASVLQSLVPVIAFVGEVLSNVGTIARVAGAFMAGWIELLRQAATALGEWLGNLTGVANPAQSFTDWLKTALQSVGEAAILAAGYLAKLVGATGFLEGMIKSLQPKPALAEHKDITGLGAASQAQVTTGAAFEKSALAAAFIATGGTPEKKDTSAWLESVVAELVKIREGKDNKVDEFLAKLNQVEVLKAIKGALDTIALAVGAGKGAGDVASAIAEHPVGFAQSLFDALLGNPLPGGAKPKRPRRR